MASGHCWDELGAMAGSRRCPSPAAERRCGAAASPGDKLPQRSGAGGADRLSELGGGHDKAQNRGRTKRPFGNVRWRFRLFAAQECRWQTAVGLSIASCPLGAPARLPSRTGQQEHRGGARWGRGAGGRILAPRVQTGPRSLSAFPCRAAASAAAAATGALTHTPRHTRG